MGRHSRRIGRGIEAGRFSPRDDNILIGPDVETNRPVDHRGIPDIDILVNRNTYLCIASDIAGAGIQGSPHVSRIGLFHLDHAVRLAAAAHLIVKRDVEHR